MKMTRLNYKFIILFIITFTFAMIGGGKLPFFMFYSMLSLLLFAWIYIIMIKHFLEIKVVFKKEYYSAGDAAECITQINCDAVVPIPYIQVESNAFKNSDNGYTGEMSNVTMDENKWIRTDIKFAFRGVYDLGKVKVKIMDLFQILSFKKEFDADVRVKVYPKLYNLRLTSIGGKDIYNEALDKNGRNEDQFRIKDVRKYRLGDSLKKVHWKLSAKHDELYVKNSDNISGEEITVFIDMSKDNYNYDIIEEQIVDLAVSLTKDIISRDMGVRVIANTAATSEFTINSKDEFENYMEYLVIQKSDSKRKIEDIVYENLNKIHRANRIIIITASLEEGFIKNAIGIKNSGFLLSVFYCYKDVKSSTSEQILRKWGIECFSFDAILKGMRSESDGAN